MNNDNALLTTFENIISGVQIPKDIDQRAKSDSIELSVNEEFDKDKLISKLQEFQYSMEVKPLSYVDENKFYTYVDSAFKVYEQLIVDKEIKASKRFAWLVAISCMYNWYFQALFGNTMTGLDIEREVYSATSNPMMYLIKNCLLGTIKALTLIVGSHFGFSSIGLPQGTQIITGFYILSSLINFIKVSLQIYKRESQPLDMLKPRSAN